jgi:cell division protein FtsA
MVRAELRKIGKDVMLPGGVVLTGGGAKMQGIEDLAKEALQLPVMIGKPEGFTGIVDRINDPAFAAPVGLMLENMAHAEMAPDPGASIGQTVDRIKKTLRNLLP